MILNNIENLVLCSKSVYYEYGIDKDFIFNKEKQEKLGIEFGKKINLISLGNNLYLQMFTDTINFKIFQVRLLGTIDGKENIKFNKHYNYLYEDNVNSIIINNLNIFLVDKLKRFSFLKINKTDRNEYLVCKNYYRKQRDIYIKNMLEREIFKDKYYKYINNSLMKMLKDKVSTNLKLEIECNGRDNYYYKIKDNLETFISFYLEKSSVSSGLEMKNFKFSSNVVFNDEILQFFTSLINVAKKFLNSYVIENKYEEFNYYTQEYETKYKFYLDIDKIIGGKNE